MNRETHPLPLFLPEHATLLMLGSFPPPLHRWKMDFYYPNLQNDMWRIFGLVFFQDADYFVDKPAKTFREAAIRDFLQGRGIAVGDTVCEAVRLQDNAADKFLQVLQPLDLADTLARLPECRYLMVTGDKAAEVLLPQLRPDTPKPKVGTFSETECAGRALRLYRMPSSSRAYPLALAEKAAAYRQMFAETGLLSFQAA